MAKSKLSKAEHEQLLQTVQMFEVIAETQPNDVQSLEILKEAYVNLGRETDAAKVSKKVAQAYLRMGQLSSAILEYEGILQKIPDDKESIDALAELENKMAALTGGGAAEDSKRSGGVFKAAEQFEDGNEALARFFQEQQLFSEKDAKSTLLALATAAGQIPADKPAPALITIISERGIASIDKSLELLAEKTRLPYLPMGSYDVDSSKSAQLEKEFCLRHLVLPFDQVSKTLFVATVNPFDSQAKHHVEGTTECRVQWYLASPLDLTKSLKDVFRIT